MTSIQSQQAIDKLRTAGLKRSEFQVRTERRYIGCHPETGCQMYEYGDPEIIIWANKKRQISLAQEMADQGLYVELYKFADGRDGYPHIEDSWKCQYKPGLYLRDAGNLDKMGFDTITKIA